jgi:hypothetical protein
MKTWGLGYEKAKEKAKQIYSKIGSIPCPIFSNEKIAFTSRGFNHLIRKGRIPRPKNEQKKRFALLEHAEKIVKNPNLRASIEFEEKEITEKVDKFGSKVLVKKMARFWTIVEEIDGCRIKLVIWEVENRQKEFLSIMGDNGIKIDNQKKLASNKKAL